MTFKEKEFYILTFPYTTLTDRKQLLFFEDYNLAQIRINTEIKFNKVPVTVNKVRYVGKEQYETTLVGVFSPNDDAVPEMEND